MVLKVRLAAVHAYFFDFVPGESLKEQLIQGAPIPTLTLFQDARLKKVHPIEPGRRMHHQLQLEICI